MNNETMNENRFILKIWTVVSVAIAVALLFNFIHSLLNEDVQFAYWHLGSLAFSLLAVWALRQECKEDEKQGQHIDWKK